MELLGVHAELISTALSNLEVENKELTGRTLLDVSGSKNILDGPTLTFPRFPAMIVSSRHLVLTHTDIVRVIRKS